MKTRIDFDFVCPKCGKMEFGTDFSSTPYSRNFHCGHATWNMDEDWKYAQISMKTTFANRREFDEAYAKAERACE